MVTMAINARIWAEPFGATDSLRSPLTFVVRRHVLMLANEEEI